MVAGAVGLHFLNALIPVEEVHNTGLVIVTVQVQPMEDYGVMERT